ncbi:MAG TPA: hypothetical protein PK095_17980 [Myxococcota bacterium]|nr:hypothetical protein [Myxococcota bacterium]
MRLTPAHLVTASLAPLAFTTLVACGDDGATGDSDTSGDISEIETSPDTTDTADTTAMTGEIDGTWAMVETQTALVEVLGAVMEQRSVSYYRAVIADGKLTVGLCDWKTEDDNRLYTTVMRPSLLAALGTFERDLTLTPNGTGFDLATTEGVTTRGLNLTDLLTDTMPTEASDARVIDQDSDSNPGISLIIQGILQGELYVIHRHKATLSGALESDTRISGRTAWTTEQVLLGSTPPELAEQDPKPQTHPDPSKSTFVMVKAEAGDDCAALNAKRATLFP